MTKPELKPVSESVPELFETPATESKPTLTPTEGNAPPSWFAQTYGTEKPDDLVGRYRARVKNDLPETADGDAYEAYRRRLEARFQAAKTKAAHEPVPERATHEMPIRRPIPAEPQPDEGQTQFRQWQHRQYAHGMTAAKAAPRGLSTMRTMALLLMACSVGGAAGFATTQSATLAQVGTTVQTVAWQLGDRLADLLPAPAADVPQPQATTQSTNTTLVKKPIKMARLDVMDVQGALNNPIPLQLEATSENPDIPLSIKISGLPQSAYLTSGTEIAAGEWLLKPSEIANVNLVVPSSAEPVLDLAVAAVEARTGAPAAPAQAMMVELDLANAQVLPVSAAPEVQSTQTRPVPPADMPQATGIDDLVAKGRTMMENGDVLTARQFFETAHSQGNAAAAFDVARTYDPLVYAELKVRGLAPDKDKAIAWYQRAGSPEAQDALSRLTSQ